MDNLHNEILELYQDLYKEVINANAKNKKTRKKGALTICPAITGKNYKQGGLMFVGRAINSWCPLKDTVINEVIKERIERCEKCTLNWVVGKENWKYCNENGCPYAQGEDRLDGRKNSTPFWQMVEYICAMNNITDNWQEQIVWSNLYKASYENGENPTSFYKQQIDICNELLIKEIEYYKPKSIYFITEKNTEGEMTKEDRVWFCEEYKNPKIQFKKVYDYLRQQKDIKVFVLTRPEFQIKERIYKAKQNLEGDRIEE